jgi:hypothetical protein
LFFAEFGLGVGFLARQIRQHSQRPMKSRPGAMPATQPEAKLQLLTSRALSADKRATAAKGNARLAKARFKAARKHFKLAKKAARKTQKEAKRAQKALQQLLGKLAKQRKQKRPAPSKRAGQLRAAATANTGKPHLDGYKRKRARAGTDEGADSTLKRASVEATEPGHSGPPSVG